MKISAWFAFIIITLLTFGTIGATLAAIWHDMSPEQQDAMAALVYRHGGIPIVGGVILAVMMGFFVNLMYQWYVAPVQTIADDTRIITVTNPAHRLTVDGKSEIAGLAASINGIANRYQDLLKDVETRVQETSAALEEERNTLAALVSNLTQGVLVCNTDGRILLYNQQARSLLEGPVWRSSTQWIGLGRSIYGFLDKDAVAHALISIEYRLSQGETSLMVPFVTSRPNGQLLSVHLVPVLDTDNQARGYVFTLEDITGRIGSENRQKTLLTTLTDEHRSILTGIRAAIETIIEYPDMDEAGRTQFLKSIRDDAVKMSEQLNELAEEQPQDFASQWAFQEMLGGDLLAIIEMELAKATGMTIKTSAPVEPVWLRVDSYALGRCILFLHDRLVHACRAEDVRLALEREQQLAAMTLKWSGARLHTEALKSWGMLTVPMGEQESSGSLFEIIERHGGAIYAHPGTAISRSSLRLVLPVLEDQSRAGDAEADERAPSHEFDFTLFQTTDGPADRNATPLEKLTYTVLDTEATGLRPSDGDELIAIGAVRIVNGRILRRETFDCLIDPHRSISEEAETVHGLTIGMLRGRPTVDEVIPRFRRFVEDTVIVGHNVAFDMRFFELKETATGIKFDNPVLDTLQLSSIAQPGHESQALDEACERLGIAITGRHTALGDALATAEVFLALIPMLKAEGITTLPQALTACQGTKYAKLKY